jgi:hypothetical protein
MPAANPSDSYNMAANALFARTLEPGERLIWEGRPRRDAPLLVGFLYFILVSQLAVIFPKALRPHNASLPLLLQAELIAMGALFALAGIPIVVRIYRAWASAYAITDNRLLMAVGKGPRAIRTIALTTLGEVGILRRKGVAALYFRGRGDTLIPKPQTTGVWRYADTHEIDKRRHVWLVRDPDAVRQIIEAARASACEPGLLRHPVAG